jgi:hypothetical protein
MAARQQFHRARWGGTGPVGSPSNPVKAILPRPSGLAAVAVRTPGVMEQAEAAAQQRGIASYSKAQQSSIEAAYKQYGTGDVTSPLDPQAVAALRASSVLRAELKDKAQSLRVSSMASGAAAPKRQLSERDYGVVHISPSRKQSKSLDARLHQRLQACVPSSRSPDAKATAQQASSDLNQFILNDLSLTDGAAAASKNAVALRTAITNCLIQSSDNLSEVPMRCKCELAQLRESGLFQSGPAKIRVVLSCGLAVEVQLLPHEWEDVSVMMTGLPPEITHADACIIVADLLKGATSSFTLKASSELASCEEGQLSGLERLGIQVVSPPSVAPSSGSQRVRQSRRDLLLRVRRSAVSSLPPTTPVMVVTVDAAGQPESTEIVWVQFKVDAKDGHTDARKCFNCGGEGHIAFGCPVAAGRAGVLASYSVFTRAPTQASVRQQQSPLTAPGQQQQQQQQQQQHQHQHQQQQQPLLSVSEDGFSTATANQRANNRQLNQQSTSSNKQATVMAGSTCAETGSGAVTGQDSVVPRQDESDDAAALATCVRRDPKQMLQRLEEANLTLTLCLDSDNAVDAQHVQRFEQLMAEHAASIKTLSTAQALAVQALADLEATPAPKYPKGKSKGKPNSTQAAELKAFERQQAARDDTLATASAEVADLQAVTLEFQAFTETLQRYKACQPSRDAPHQQLSTALSSSPADSEVTESQLSPVITFPPDSQEEVSVAASSLNSPEASSARAAAAEEEPAVTTASAADPLDAEAVATSTAVAVALADGARAADLRAQPTASRAAVLEESRDKLLLRSRDAFDAAEQIGVDAEQSRSLARAASNNTAQPRPSTEATSDQQDDVCGVSGTEHSSLSADDSSDSFNSGSSEDSEEECSDAESETGTRPTSTQADTSTQQQPDSESTPATRQLRSHSAKAKLADQTPAKTVTAASK